MARFARLLCCGLLLSSLALARPFPEKPQTPAKKPVKTASTDYKSVHNSAIVVDTHADTPMRFTDEHFDPGKDAGHGHWDLAKAKTGNLGVEFFSIWVEPNHNKGQWAHRAFDMIDSVYQVVQAHPDEMIMAGSTKEIYAARRGPNKKIAVLMGVEGGHAIENDLGILRDYYRLGVRYMTLTWANSTDWAQSSGDVKKDEKTGKPIDPGLNDFGRSVVREMNRLGMMVDISHVSDRSFYHALTVSRAPVIASHSGARAVADVPRNMTDDMLVALARNGGVAQVNFNCGFVSNEYNKRSDEFSKAHPEEVKKLRDLWRQYTQDHSAATYSQLQDMEVEFEKYVPRPPLSALIDHIDHIAKVAGIDHVGLGSDFDGVTCLPKEINSVADLPKITQALLQRGYTPEQIHKVLGGNLLRVFADVEKVARDLAHEKPQDQREEVAMPAGTVAQPAPAPPKK